MSNFPIIVRNAYTKLSPMLWKNKILCLENGDSKLPALCERYFDASVNKTLNIRADLVLLAKSVLANSECPDDE